MLDGEQPYRVVGNPTQSFSRPPDRLNNCQSTSSRPLYIYYLEPRVRFPKQLFKTLCCPLIAVQQGKHGEVEVPIQKASLTSIKHGVLRNHCINKHHTTHRGYFSVHLVSGPSFNKNSNNTTFDPSIIAGTKALKTRTAYLSLHMCNIHLKK